MKFVIVFFVACLLAGGCISCSENPSDIQRRGARHYNAGEFSQAVACFRKAAEKGDAEAQLNLGLCYDNGRGVEKNNFEAAKWFRKSAEQGNVKAQFFLGMCYFSGVGVTKNKFEAVKWFRQAAEQGSSYGQFMLCTCYFNGKGIEKNAMEAVKWFRKAIEPREENILLDEEVTKGVEKSEGYFCLGGCYYLGQGVATDKEKAIELWRKAEELGSKHATEALRRHFNEE